MKGEMGPPPPLPPQNPSPTSKPNSNSSTESQMETSIPPPSTKKSPMGPPPAKFSMPPPEPKEETNSSNMTEEIQVILSNTHVEQEQEPTKEEELERKETPQLPKPVSKPAIPDSITKESPGLSIPYTIPPWSEAPCHPFFLEVLKDGSIIDSLQVSEKGAYMFGRVDLCDFVLDHPTISRFHAVLQFKQSGESYIYDLGSTHGTSVNKNQVKKKVYTELHVGDVIRFGHSSRLYVFQGPTELMPPEGDLKKIRSSKFLEEMRDREASLLRAKREAALADGISWGMAEDAIEEAEEDTEEVTWQTYKGQLTERQQKTRDKVLKRIEKIANMKKEIDAIRAKDIPQGGLTQGQQTQIARNDQRTAQILEELESLEETLNESIQESLGARSGKVRSKKRGVVVEEEDEAPSDDDDFYDRTKKPATQKAGEQSIETADSLLDKKDAIMEEMENKRNLINEKNKTIPEIENEIGDDPLDAYMTGLSSKLVLDSAMKLQQELSSLQSELDRILYLLKIADPSGEAAKKRESKPKASNSNEVEVPTSGTTSRVEKTERKKKPTSSKTKDEPTLQEKAPEDSNTKVPPEVDQTVKESKTTPVYTVTKPQWLGAIHDTEMKETPRQEVNLDTHEADEFVDYKDRKEVLGTVAIEDAAPGLIIRKRKPVEKPEEPPQVSTSVSAEAETQALDAVALLLKHKKGFVVSDEEDEFSGGQSRKESKKAKKVVGPEKPEYLDTNPEYETWVPPKGQSGDGRTSLNDRFGY